MNREHFLGSREEFTSFDPDGHLIEVSESMYSVACKQFKVGKTIEETVKLVQQSDKR